MKNLKLKLIPRKINTLLVFLLFAVFLKELIFSAIIPIWHTPDEQAHFAQVAFFTEYGRMPNEALDLNREILESERFLGTERNQNGNNKFTYRPEYKIEYLEGNIGKYEEEIKQLPENFRKELVKQEATNYPPLFYWLSAVLYKLFYHSDLITRIYVVRILGVILSLLTIFVTYLIGKQLFPKNLIYQFTLSIMVAFQPMLSFLFAGVNSDNLMNFLFATVIYCCLLMINQGIKVKYLLALTLVVLLLFLTKPQFLFALPVIFVALAISFLIDKRVSKTLKQVIGLSVLFIVGLSLYLISNGVAYDLLYNIPILSSFAPGSPNLNVKITFLQFLKESLIRTYQETLPWYWGVFDWLGVVLPRDANRVINRLLILALAGVFIKLLLIIKKPKREDALFIFLLLTSVIYFFSIIIYNYFFTLAHGFSFGLQGRYFFPTVTAHMAVVLIGFIILIPSRLTKLKNWWIKLIGILMIVLNFVALWTISKTYYDTSSISLFITQASQYKIDLFKGPSLAFLMVLYLLILVVFTYKFLRLNSSGGNLGES